MKRDTARLQGPRTASRLAAFLAALALGMAGCDGDDGDQGPAGPPGPPGPPGSGADGSVLLPGEAGPGVDVAILGLSGGTGANGTFQPGDTLSVTYTLQRDDGTGWDPTQMDRGRALVSGPTFNYQRVLAEQDIREASVGNADGSWTYTFPEPIPAAYLPPLGDSDAFGPGDGELAGQALLGGTYTIAVYFRWPYTVEGESYRDVGNATLDFLLGGATEIASRAVVGQDNCNQCHETLQAHGGSRREVTLCLMCHTAGAEDNNDPNIAGGTPGTSIEFSVMLHKIHSGLHLPSVLGVGTNEDGTRDYLREPEEYVVVGGSGTIHDYSEVGFPVWPNLSFPLPRDEGYSALTPEARAKEDSIRSGPANCATCHGDPDGDGPIVAPAQGELIHSQLKRRTCGACHDDVDWTRPYMSNSMSMPAQNDDSACTLCHDPSGTPIAVQDAHRHPMTDPSFNPGLEIALLSAGPAGAAAGANVQPGDRVAVSFTARDAEGADVDPLVVGTISAVLSGPTNNYNLVLNASIPPTALSGPQPYTVNLPERVYLEPIGVATPALDMFSTARAPHWNVTGATTDLLARTGATGGSSTLAAAVDAPANFIDLVSTAGFARNEYVVIEPDPAVTGGAPPDEYLQIQWVDGNRLWFSSPYSPGYAPGPQRDHAVGAAVREVQVATLTSGTHYMLDAPTGTVTEVAFTDGQTIIASYTSDFIVPEVYPLALNHSPGLDDGSGRWTGKSLVDGTYTVGLWGGPTLTFTEHGESNSYRGTATAVGFDFLVGASTTLEPYNLIDSDGTCLACHQDIYFHGGGRRGFTSCVLCHGTAGSEDRPRYVAAGAPDTTALTVNFRTMLHKIHHGEELANASTYTVVGFGNGYPNNYSTHTYGEVVFPALPGGTQDCAKCHGSESEAWQEPAPRNHPTEQLVPTRSWTVTCGSCHDSDSVQAHIASQTSPSGAEACAVCHGGGDELSVPNAHFIR